MTVSTITPCSSTAVLNAVNGAEVSKASQTHFVAHHHLKCVVQLSIRFLYHQYFYNYNGTNGMGGEGITCSEEPDFPSAVRRIRIRISTYIEGI